MKQEAPEIIQAKQFLKTKKVLGMREFEILVRIGKKEGLKIAKGMIEKHKNCKKMHKIKGCNATCLDIVLDDIKKVV